MRLLLWFFLAFWFLEHRWQLTKGLDQYLYQALNFKLMFIKQQKICLLTKEIRFWMRPIMHIWMINSAKLVNMIGHLKNKFVFPYIVYGNISYPYFHVFLRFDKTYWSMIWISVRNPQRHRNIIVIPLKIVQVLFLYISIVTLY